MYVPELIFGHLLTSSNYDDSEKKTVGGRNGLWRETRQHLLHLLHCHHP